MSEKPRSMSYSYEDTPQPGNEDAPGASGQKDEAIPFDDEPLDLIGEDDEGAGETEIHGISSGGEQSVRDERRWKRSANVSGEGAVRMKLFYAKLRPDAMESLNDQVNEWLDANPQYEVKFATTTTGDLMGKAREPAIFISVWV